VPAERNGKGEWRARLCALREAERDALMAALTELANVGFALAYDETLTTDIRRTAALLRDRINERETEIRALEIAEREAAA